MKYSKIGFLKDTVYYVLIVFEDKNKSGKTISNEYKVFSNAEKKFESLVKSGRYERMMLRKEEVCKRSPTCEISNSKPLKIWEAS